MTDAKDGRVASSLAPDGGAPAAGGLPESLRLGHVRLQVGDLAASLDYYTTVLGLRARATGETTAALHAADDPAPLIELSERRGVRPVRAQSRLGLYHFALLLPDRASLGRFLGHLAQAGTRLGASDHLVSEAIYLRDPDGLGIEVYADRPPTEWRYVHGQIAMSTDPLDTASVLAAAHGEPWTEMPRGTVMGHVHLHVGDIDAASSFYHGALGLERTVWSYPGALFLAAGGYHHHLGVNTWAGAQAAPPAEDDAQLLDWRMILPDQGSVAAAVQRLASAGHELAETNEGWLTADPWGTRLRLLAG